MLESTPQTNNELTVSQLSTAIRLTLEQCFEQVRVRGEISGLKIATSGHIYFNLKDDKSVIAAICWRGVASQLPFKLEEGAEVICIGKVTTYEARSNYQIIVNSIEAAGIGALLAMLEKRKKLLEAEGLFARERKKPLPFLPKTIAIITSPPGAVIRDILHRINDRFPIHVVVFPVLVQGPSAKDQIAAAITAANAVPEDKLKIDLIIVARGGGSIEDLWAFNEEVVVRAAANSRIPLISAVGHETDTTLIDYAADLRAPTPTAAAEIAIAVRTELLQMLAIMGQRVAKALPNLFFKLENKLARSQHILNNFKTKLHQIEIKIQSLAAKLSRSLITFTQIKEHSFIKLAHKLTAKTLEYKIQLLQNKLAMAGNRLSMDKILEPKINMLKLQSKLLENMDYRKTLNRGFTVFKSTSVKIISRMVAITGSRVQVEFYDGDIELITPTSRTAKSKDTKEEQGLLF
jgi:exodeoxyribonuclease VII large subunit